MGQPIVPPTPKRAARCLRPMLNCIRPTRLRLRGRDAIEALHASWTHGHSEATDKKMKVMHAGRSGDLAWCLANTQALEAGNGTSVDVFERPTGHGSYACAALTAPTEE